MTNPQNLPAGSSQGSRSVARVETFQGPIPPPSVLEAYEKILPGAAERILKMAENQSTHRQEIEKIVVRSGVRDQRNGVMVAAIVVICAFVWSGYALAVGQSAEAIKVILSTIVTLAGAFLFGKMATKQERMERARINQPRS